MYWYLFQDKFIYTAQSPIPVEGVAVRDVSSKFQTEITSNIYEHKIAFVVVTDKMCAIPKLLQPLH